MAAAAIAAAVVVVAVVPATRDVAEWLLTDRYWVGSEPASVSAERAVAEWMAAQDEPYVGTCPDPEAGLGSSSSFSWCTLPAHPITVDDVPIVDEFGVTEGQILTLGGVGWWDTFHAERIVLEGTDGWYVAAVRRLAEIMEGPPGPWLPPEVGVELDPPRGD